MLRRQESGLPLLGPMDPLELSTALATIGDVRKRQVDARVHDALAFSPTFGEGKVKTPWVEEVPLDGSSTAIVVGAVSALMDLHPGMRSVTIKAIHRVHNSQQHRNYETCRLNLRMFVFISFHSSVQ